MEIYNFNKSILVLIVILMIAGVFFLVKKQKPRSNYSPPSRSEASQSTTTPKLEYTISEVSFDKLPGDFPRNVPLESGAKIIKNYTSITPAGELGATRTFESLRSIGQNSSVYEKFFQQNKWEIKKLVDQDDFRAMSAKPDRLHEFSVLIRRDSATSKVTVEISYYTFPKK